MRLAYNCSGLRKVLLVIFYPPTYIFVSRKCPVGHLHKEHRCPTAASTCSTVPYHKHWNELEVIINNRGHYRRSKQLSLNIAAVSLPKPNDNITNSQSVSEDLDIDIPNTNILILDHLASSAPATIHQVPDYLNIVNILNASVYQPLNPRLPSRHRISEHKLLSIST